jgi:hypothetical protein
MGAAAIIIRKERDIVDLYRQAGATSPATARRPDDLGIHHRVAFNILVRRAVLREVSDGRYYLDEPSWEALRTLRHRIAALTIIVVLVVLGVMIGAGVVGVGFGIPHLH